MRTLVVYHSRSGYTRRVAESLAHRLHADIEEIVVEPRPGPLGYLRCAFEALLAMRTRIRTPKYDPSDYGLVVIGTPVWFWRLSSPVRTYLASRRRRLSRVAFFCTMGGSGERRVFDTMAAVGGKPPVATLALTDGDIDAHRHARIDAFVQALQHRGPTATRPATRPTPKRASGARHAAA